jgi:hypothetical protein
MSLLRSWENYFGFVLQRCRPYGPGAQQTIPLMTGQHWEKARPCPPAPGKSGGDRPGGTAIAKDAAETEAAVSGGLAPAWLLSWLRPTRVMPGWRLACLPFSWPPCASTPRFPEAPSSVAQSRLSTSVDQRMPLSATIRRRAFTAMHFYSCRTDRDRAQRPPRISPTVSSRAAQSGWRFRLSQ